MKKVRYDSLSLAAVRLASLEPRRQRGPDGSQRAALADRQTDGLIADIFQSPQVTGMRIQK